MDGETTKPLHPYRVALGFAVTVTTLGVLGMVAGISASGTDSGGLAVVAAAVSLCFAAFLWWVVYQTRRKGYRWSTTTTPGEPSKPSEDRSTG